MFSQLSRWEGVQFPIYWIIYWDGESEKFLKNPFCSLFISVLNNNGMNNHKLTAVKQKFGERRTTQTPAGAETAAPSQSLTPTALALAKICPGRLKLGCRKLKSMQGKFDGCCGFSVLTENWSSWEEGWCSSRLPPAFEAGTKTTPSFPFSKVLWCQGVSLSRHLYQEEPGKDSPCQSDIHTRPKLCMFCSFYF